jgi:hypothetical protein
VPLAEIGVGQSVEVLRVYEKDPRFLEFLSELRLRPGARLRVSGREYDETMTLFVHSRPPRRVHLGLPATSRIWVRRTG